MKKDQCYFSTENMNSKIYTNIKYVIILLAFHFNIFSFQFQVLLILCDFVIKVYFFYLSFSFNNCDTSY